MGYGSIPPEAYKDAPWGLRLIMVALPIVVDVMGLLIGSMLLAVGIMLAVVFGLLILVIIRLIILDRLEERPYAPSLEETKTSVMGVLADELLKTSEVRMRLSAPQPQHHKVLQALRPWPERGEQSATHPPQEEVRRSQHTGGRQRTTPPTRAYRSRRLGQRPQPDAALHFDFASREFQDMKMQPSRERAQRHRELLRA